MKHKPKERKKTFERDFKKMVKRGQRRRPYAAK